MCGICHFTVGLNSEKSDSVLHLYLLFTNINICCKNIYVLGLCVTSLWFLTLIKLIRYAIEK